LTSAAGFPTNPRADVELIVWDLEKSISLHNSTGFERSLSSLALAPDGSVMATASHNGGLRWWEINSARDSESVVECLAPLCSLAFTANGQYLASASYRNELILCDRNGKRLWSSPAGHDRFAQALAFSPDGRVLVSGGTDGVIRVWDPALGTSAGSIGWHATPVLAAAFSPEGRTLATGDREGIVKIWNRSAAKETTFKFSTECNSAPQRFGDEISALAFSPDGRVLAVAKDSCVQLWDASAWTMTGESAGNDGKVHCLAFSHDGKLLATGHQNGVIRVLDMAFQSDKLP
jgi:WD40 repeat protein